MPLVPAFTVSQTLSAPEDISLTDTSTGSDAAVTQRRIYFQKSDGTYLVPAGTLTDYVPWPLASTTIDVTGILDGDYGLSIRVDWLNVANVVLYTASNTFSFTINSELFYYNLTQAQAATGGVITADSNYYRNKLVLRVEIDNANNAIGYGSDVSAAQEALDRAALMIVNESQFF